MANRKHFYMNPKFIQNSTVHQEYSDRERRLEASNYFPNTQEFNRHSSANYHQLNPNSLPAYNAPGSQYFMQPQLFDNSQVALSYAHGVGTLQSNTLPTQQPNTPQQEYGVFGIPGKCWRKLVGEHGETPGAQYDSGKVEVFNLPLPPFLKSQRRLIGPREQTKQRIENFCRADLRFMKCQPPYTHGLRITGTVEQAYYAIQACNAVICDELKPQVYWVILEITGPKLRSTALALKEGLKDLIPENNFIDENNLHVTAAWVDIEYRDRHEELLNVVTDTVREISRTRTAANLTGRFEGEVFCSNKSISVKAQGEDNPLKIIPDVFQRKFKEKNFLLIGRSSVHMTLMSSNVTNGSEVDKGKQLTGEVLRERGLSLDFGPVQIKRVSVSCKEKLLQGHSFNTVARFPLTPRLI